MATLLRQETRPSAPGGSQSVHTQISYSYVLGQTWVECGISKVNNLLSALGFTTARQVAAFCA